MTVFLYAAALFLSVATTAFAQSATATIVGRVVDSQGLPMPGVAIVAASPNLQGTRETVTSVNGDYIISLLPSGTYTVRFELTGFTTQTRTLMLAPTQVAPLEVEMGPAGVSERVEVVGRTADVLTETAQVATNFSQDLIALLPTARDLNATLMLAPSVHPTGPSGGYSIAGSMSFENLFLVNGVTVNENMRGQAFDLYIEDAIQETTVATAGVSAEYGRFGGGVVNIITKSGGNMFRGSFRDTLNNDKWRKMSPFEKSPDAGVNAGRDLRIDNVVPTYEYTFGGPAMLDRIWFFTAGRLQKQESGRNTAITAIPYSFVEDAKRYEFKGTYSLNSNHRFQGAYTKHDRKQLNSTFNQNLSMDMASLGDRRLPENLSTVNYTGVLASNFFVEGRYSNRHQSFIGSGSRYTDLVRGTLLLDRSRGNTRYWTDTFCGVCDTEKRDNEDYFGKAEYFLSTKSLGSHSMTFGYDLFNDKRFANNHQSGSDYRILGTSSIIQGAGASAVIYPQFLGDGTTIIQWNPIPLGSQGSNFRTHSVFYNNAWRVNDRLTANLGVRYDKNDGQNQAGQTVITDDAWSPRLGVIFSPTGNPSWTMTGSVAKYVTAISQSIADASSAGGNFETRQFIYRGPHINPAGTTNLVTPDVAIRQLFDWYFANGAANLPLNGAPGIPGVSPQIGDLTSPHVWEYAVGTSRTKGRATVRTDFVFRNYRSFYADFTTPGVRAQDKEGRSYDLITIGNDEDHAKRRYAGWTAQGTYRWTSVDIGGTYTLSRNWGNFEGETIANGPIRFEGSRYPEYKQASWDFPVGDLSSDQRHRSRLWLNYQPALARGLMVSLLQTMESGVPYGAGGREAIAPDGAVTSGVDPRPYIANPGYFTPPSGANTTYFYTARDAFRTEAQFRADLGISYAYRMPRSRGLEFFAQLQVINLFNQSQLCACGGTVFGTGSAANAGGINIQRINTAILTPVTTATLQAFNPFTTVPVRGANWDLNPNFGRAVSRLAYTTPQSMRVSFGVRF